LFCNLEQRKHLWQSHPKSNDVDAELRVLRISGYAGNPDVTPRSPATKAAGEPEWETCLSTLVSQTSTGLDLGLDGIAQGDLMAFRKSLHRAFGVGGILFGSALLCASAAAQSAVLENGQGLNGARTPLKSTATGVQSRPDIFSPSYVPPNSRPKPNVITAPRLVYYVDPQFPADAPKGKFLGVSVVALLVGTDGKPEQVRMVKSLGPEFDRAAVAAVARYRFEPALKHGKPVPVKVNVEVNFRRY
jgi:TonB family protein